MGVDEQCLGVVPSLGLGAHLEKQLHALNVQRRYFAVKLCTSSGREAMVQ